MHARSRRTSLSLTMCLSLCALSATGQEQPTPTPPAAGTGVLLAHKFKPGQVRHFRLEANGTMSLNIGAAAALGPIPMDVKSAGTMRETTKAVTDGVASLMQQVDTYNLTTNVLGTVMGFKVAGGKTTMTLNGQPAPAGSGPAGLGMAQLAQITKPTSFTRSTLGQEVRQAADAVSQAAGVDSVGLIFPDRALNVGDTWEHNQKSRLRGAGPLAGAGQPTEVETRFTYTLKSIEDKGATKHALIEVTGSALAPTAEGTPAATQDSAGKLRFDINRGVIVSASVKMNFSTPIPGAALAAAGAGGTGGGAPAGAGGAPGAGGGQVDGEVTVTLMEYTPKPAPAKKKAAPVRRRR